ncbi:MAG: hypothetical protein ACHQK9_09970 [Reyranellales bacterium]
MAIGVPMNWLRPLRHVALGVLALSLGGCGELPLSWPTYANPKAVSRVDRQAAIRNACLARNAAPFASDSSDAASTAQAIALACKPETDRLIALLNPHEDPQITVALQKDAAFRATGYVLKARGQADAEYPRPAEFTGQPVVAP